MTSLLKKFGGFSSAVAVVAACAIPLAAQPPTTPPTCTTPPASITTFSIETVRTLSNLLSAFPPTGLPANVLASITSGAQEVRSRIIYNPQQGTVTDTTFLVAPGSPSLTPLSVDVSQQTLAVEVLQVDKVYTSCKPTPSIMFVGTLSGNPGALGNPTGAPAAISIGYTTDNPPKINNVVTLIAGQAVAYSPAAAGTVTFPAAPVTPTTTAGAPTIVINPVPVNPGSLQVFFNPYHLDASQSTDPNKLALTYLWSSDKPANFLPSNTDPAPNIQFNSGAGDYNITLTVTNSAGISSKTTFVLTYIGKQ